jgi:tRNA-dihydrouridine synthase B
MIGRGAQGRPWFPGHVARYLDGGPAEATPPLDVQHRTIAALYDEMLTHHGERIGIRHARKHLGWALDVAAATVNLAADALWAWRAHVLTAVTAGETRMRLDEAFGAMAWGAAA